mmetsp:Transcript_5608/g.15686  ORF Transcript_5608/g.15686 Transcript_5608/m.15686 type:complete len:371 (-) Transcript_5608:339-1451(-)
MSQTRLAADAYEKEQRRVANLRARNNARRDRFLNARLRTIGIDRDGIDAQIAAKEAAADAQARADYAYQQEMLRVRYALEEQELAMAQQRQAESYALRAEHQAQMALPKNEMPRVSAAQVDVDACGASSAQLFAGEDRNQKERIAQERAQFAEWCMAKKAANDEKRAAEKADEMAYHEYLMAVTKAREDNEMAMKQAMSDYTRDVAAENAERARLNDESRRNQSAADEAAKQAEIAYQTESAFLTEDMGQGINPATGRVVRDRYKGFTKEETKQYFRDNDRVIEEKQVRKANEAADERAFAAQQAHIYGMLTEMEAERALQDQRALLMQKEELLTQRMDALAKKRRDRDEKFGSVDNSVGFYAGFGQSCR